MSHLCSGASPGRPHPSGRRQSRRLHQRLLRDGKPVTPACFQRPTAVGLTLVFRGLQGYNSSSEFIISQHPLPHTTRDFWRMVWDHNAHTIVMLAATHAPVSHPAAESPPGGAAVGVTDVCAGLQAEDQFVYWPSRGEAMTCEGFSVTMVGQDQLGLSAGQQLSIHDFILEATQVCVCVCVFSWTSPLLHPSACSGRLRLRSSPLPLPKMAESSGADQQLLRADRGHPRGGGMPGRTHRRPRRVSTSTT